MLVAMPSMESEHFGELKTGNIKLTSVRCQRGLKLNKSDFDEAVLSA